MTPARSTLRARPLVCSNCWFPLPERRMLCGRLWSSEGEAGGDSSTRTSASDLTTAFARSAMEFLEQIVIWPPWLAWCLALLYFLLSHRRAVGRQVCRLLFGLLFAICGCGSQAEGALFAWPVMQRCTPHGRACLLLGSGGPLSALASWGGGPALRICRRTLTHAPLVLRGESACDAVSLLLLFCTIVSSEVWAAECGSRFSRGCVQKTDNT
jgi:hypothetical protein